MRLSAIRRIGPENGMSIATLNDIFFVAVERNLDRAHASSRVGKWLPISSREFGQNVARTAQTLHALGAFAPEIELPCSAKTVRSGRRPIWQACCSALSPSRFTPPSLPEQTAFVLNDSGCRAIFVSSDQQLQKVLSILPQTENRKDRSSWIDIEFTGDLAPYVDQAASP